MGINELRQRLSTIIEMLKQTNGMLRLIADTETVIKERAWEGPSRITETLDQINATLGRGH